MHSTQEFVHSSKSLRALGLALVAAAVGVAGCTSKSDVPPPTGPSVLALSVELAANPDILTLDGMSQSQIAISTRGPDGAAVPNVPLTVEIMAGGQIVDVGRLSAKTPTTGSDGVARVTYTAPTGAPSGNSDGEFIVSIRAIPVGTDYSTAVSRTVDIRLRPTGIILPEPHSPVPRFTISPVSPGEDQDITFDASSSIASCGPDPADPQNPDKCRPEGGTIVSYLWDFGNRRTGSGVRASTFYSSAGTYTVKLTVTNDRGLTNTATREISITAIAGPSASFTVSPQTVGVGERVNVDASASKPTADRFINEYNWSWGDGSRSSGQFQSHSYAQAGSFTIVLTVVDSTGRTGTTSQSVTVGAGQLPTAAFNFSPTAPRANQLVAFDATVSTAPPGRTIVNHEWNFGDNTPILSGNEPRPTHTYASPGSYVVTLTVRDSNGAKSAAITRTITIAP